MIVECPLDQASDSTSRSSLLHSRVGRHRFCLRVEHKLQPDLGFFGFGVYACSTHDCGEYRRCGLTWSTTSASINKVVGSTTSSYFFPYAQVCGNASCSAILICRDCAALTSVTPNFTQSTLYNLTAEEYSGVSVIGITKTATGTSTAPSITITTGDPNDWLVALAPVSVIQGYPPRASATCAMRLVQGHRAVASPVRHATTPSRLLEASLAL